MSFKHSCREWVAGSARVDGNIDSDHPTWVLSAMRGRMRIDLASGPLGTRAVAENFALWMNDQDPVRWDWLIEHELRRVVEGTWG